MATISNAGKTRAHYHQLQKTNQFIRSITNKQKRQQQTILFLLHQEKIFEFQNNREMVTNSRISKDRKRSSQRPRLNCNLRKDLPERTVTLTPKFKKHIVSQSKLPPLRAKNKKQIQQPNVTLTPWELESSEGLARPHSSKFLPY